MRRVFLPLAAAVLLLGAGPAAAMPASSPTPATGQQSPSVPTASAATAENALPVVDVRYFRRGFRHRGFRRGFHPRFRRGFRHRGFRRGFVRGYGPRFRRGFFVPRRKFFRPRAFLRPRPFFFDRGFTGAVTIGGPFVSGTFVFD
ncbi:MAG: hypothetical protein AAF899_14085 [Pseudomonadota bacterium]